MNNRVCNQAIGSRESEETRRNMKRTIVVVIITLVTMFAEIFFGLVTGSMALLADGIHMGTHTFALVVTLIAYYISNRHADNPGFAFSSGKVGVLGGYTNAIILGITAVFMVNEAVHRILNPETINFNQALMVAIIGLVINIFSALLLSGKNHSHAGHSHSHHDHETEHSHEHSHEKQETEEFQDHNLRSAYVHVLTDAMTSVLAIIALIGGSLFGQTWPDAAVAILGALVILKWAFDLLMSSGKLLVDYYPAEKESEEIRHIAESKGFELVDLHIWKTSANEKAAIVTLESSSKNSREEILQAVRSVCSLQHVTLEFI